ncbi:hypothetical protein DL546_001598 [Coniochaeta pulveracea]|uniref:Uncharacterized protein n=1 Tax=Coniochaeta pulveracea TaxID=177199 RepID=A0A420Y5I7_9PEZI|nr:hypothetical protein DL546_001598 [Coniochaeta pulveracea]
MLRGMDIPQSSIYNGNSATTATVASAYKSRVGDTGLGGRDIPMDNERDTLQTTIPYPVTSTSKDDLKLHSVQLSQEKVQVPTPTGNSQDTSTTTETVDTVFTPPASESGQSQTNSQGNAQDSSQESQLLQLSQLAAAQERMPDTGKPHGGDNDGNNGQSRKRMADGMVKDGASPKRVPGHSRNTSAVSVASTTGSRIGELSAELKTRLSYAMVKVSHGWQSHSIDQVETLASQSASPTSSNATIHLRQGSSASPQLSTSSHRGSTSSTPATRVQHSFTSRVPDSTYATWREFQGQSGRPSPPMASNPAPALAPPVTIQPSQRPMNHRRNSHARHMPSLLTHSHQASPVTGPNTPGESSPYPSANNRTPLIDPALFSPQAQGTPHQNVREQDAMEALLFMSSPGNSANLKHNFPSSSQPARSNLHRTALPSGAPRKSLPSGRPQPQPPAQPPPKRVGFEQQSHDMEVDQPHAKGRKINGTDSAPVARFKHIPLSSGLSLPSHSRRVLADSDIDRMLERAAAEESSDSEGEIQIPMRRPSNQSAPPVAL